MSSCTLVQHEAGQTTVSLVEEEARRVEPWLALAFAERVQVPAALLGVRCEGPVVDREPRSLVLPGLERPGDDRGMVSSSGRERRIWYRSRPRPSPQRRAIASVSASGFGYPQMDVTPTLPATSAMAASRRSPDDLPRRGAVVGSDDDLDAPCAVAPAHLGVAHSGPLGAFAGDEAGETRPPSVDQVEPLVLAERPVAVGRVAASSSSATSAMSDSPILRLTST